MKEIIDNAYSLMLNKPGMDKCTNLKRIFQVFESLLIEDKDILELLDLAWNDENEELIRENFQILEDYYSSIYFHRLNMIYIKFLYKNEIYYAIQFTDGKIFNPYKTKYIFIKIDKNSSNNYERDIFELFDVFWFETDDYIFSESFWEEEGCISYCKPKFEITDEDTKDFYIDFQETKLEMMPKDFINNYVYNLID